MAQMTMVQAINNALKTELQNDENVLIFGEDVGVTAVYSVLLKVYKKNSVKTVYSTHH